MASLHGAKDAAERDAIIDGFRAGKDKVSHNSVLISFTHSMSLGSNHDECHCPGHRHHASEHGS